MWDAFHFRREKWNEAAVPWPARGGGGSQAFGLCSSAATGRAGASTIRRLLLIEYWARGTVAGFGRDVDSDATAAALPHGDFGTPRLCQDIRCEHCGTAVDVERARAAVPVDGSA